MGKNSDTKNIFDSYFGGVLLKEAVIDTENDGITSSNDPNFIKKLLQNPNLKPEAKGKLENRLKQLESGSNNPPAGTMTVDQAKQTIANQQSQNAAPSQGTVVNAPDASSSATNPTAKKVAPFKNRSEAAAYAQSGQAKKDYDAAQTLAKEKEAEIQKQLPYPNPKNRSEAAANAAARVKLQNSTATTPKQEVPAQPATTAPQAQQSGVSLNDPNSISLGGQPATTAKPADDFQQKLDADYAKFKNNTQATQPAATQPAATQPAAKSSGGGSVVNYLAASGQASDFASRSKLAAQYGIQNYKGTAEQNTQLLNKLKSGEKPTQQAATQAEPKKQQGMGGAVGGVSKAIGSAGQGLKQATIGNKKPLGGILGGISKAVGSAGKGIKKALVGDQEESEKKEENEEAFVQFEKNNIAKFLKFLSEKNYAEANKYLKNIVDYKVKKKLLVSIK